MKPLFLTILALCCVVGCLPRTTIRKDPGRFDRGVRYYRPKPYLFIKPMIGKDGVPLDGYVTLEHVTLPDFSEEYSIHVRSGLGTNDTKISLQDGWNLTALNVNIDSQFDENLRATAEILKAVPSLTASGADPRQMAVKAMNVPMGLYESVIAEGPDSKKRLYGFRYVGFMPYAACPIETHGVETQSCCDGQIFGLVFEEGAMVFKLLHETSQGNTQRVRLKADEFELLDDNAATGPQAMTTSQAVKLRENPHPLGPTEP